MVATATARVPRIVVSVVACRPADRMAPTMVIP
jgi:hypothetical protein